MAANGVEELAMLVENFKLYKLLYLKDQPVFAFATMAVFTMT